MKRFLHDAKSAKVSSPDVFVPYLISVYLSVVSPLSGRTVAEWIVCVIIRCQPTLD